MTTWREIWSKRQTETTELSLADLLQLDGFDGGAGHFQPEEWSQFVLKILRQIDFQVSDSIYEVGCGSGAFLYPIVQNYPTANFGGCDYSESLIKVARNALKMGQFEVLDAEKISTTPQYSYVASMSVFHYFDENYAQTVLRKMFQKCTKGIFVLDIPNLETKHECEEMRRAKLSIEEYQEKYKNLKHTYFSKNYFYDFCHNNNLKCNILTGEAFAPKYAQSKYRFHCFMQK